MALEISGTEKIGAIETSGFEGAIITISALFITSITPGVAFASLEPLNRTDDIATSCRYFTKYS